MVLLVDCRYIYSLTMDMTDQTAKNNRDMYYLSLYLAPLRGMLSIFTVAIIIFGKRVDLGINW